MIFTIDYVISLFRRSFKALFSSAHVFFLFALIALVNQIVLGNKAIIEDGLSMFPTAATLLYETLPNIFAVSRTSVTNYPGLIILAGILLAIYFIGSALYTIAVIRSIALIYRRKWKGLLDGL